MVPHREADDADPAPGSQPISKGTTERRTLRGGRPEQRPDASEQQRKSSIDDDSVVNASRFSGVWDSLAVTLAALALVAAVAALIVAVMALQRARPANPPLAVVVDPATPSPPGPAALIFNPSKNQDWQAVKARLIMASHEVGLPDPLFIETTVDDPGTGQARHALAAGASVVIAGGGDGTVRAVAAALAGSDTPMALLPSGTGNLLARNLDLPLTDYHELINVALTGRERPMDVGWLRVELASDTDDDDALPVPSPKGAWSPDRERDSIFLVIAGIGFDAAMVAETDDDLKAKIGWLAYGVGAVKPALGRRMTATVEVGNSAESSQFKARTIMIANCGRLPAGVTLLPDAQIDDGWLDMIAVDTRQGPIGWATLAGKILLRGLGARKNTTRSSMIDYRRGRTFSISTSSPEAVQVDGDIVGEATTIRVWADPGALIVRAY